MKNLNNRSLKRGAATVKSGKASAPSSVSASSKQGVSHVALDEVNL